MVEEAKRGVLGSREVVNIRVFFLQMVRAAVIFPRVWQVGKTLVGVEEVIIKYHGVWFGAWKCAE